MYVEGYLNLTYCDSFIIVNINSVNCVDYSSIPISVLI